MITITIKTNNVRKSINEDINETPRSVLTNQVGMTVDRTRQVSLSGMQLDDEELDMTFAALGVEENSDVVLSAIVKGDGA